MEVVILYNTKLKNEKSQFKNSLHKSGSSIELTNGHFKYQTVMNHIVQLKTTEAQDFTRAMFGNRYHYMHGKMPRDSGSRILNRPK